MKAARAILFLLAIAAPGYASVPPQQCIPLRWDGGPLELVRRERYAAWENARVEEFQRKEAQKTKAAGVFVHEEEQARPKPFATPPMDEAQKQAVRDWYDPSTLKLLDDSPYGCVLLTWSLGGDPQTEGEQRTLAGAYARQIRQRGLTALAVIEPGPEWLGAVEAASEDFDGVVLESRFPSEPSGAIPDGEFADTVAIQALDLLQKKNPQAFVVPMSSWERVQRDPRFPVLASHAGLWPGMLSPSEATGWGAGPTSNPWVLSNGWQIGVLRSESAGRPVWMGHRPKPHRAQPLDFKEYTRAVADSGMAGARWVVAVGDDWRPRLFAGESGALEEWHKLGESIRFFETQNERWSSFKLWPSVVVVHDPGEQTAFDSFDVLNMLAVRQVPHRVVLRPDFDASGVAQGTAVIAFDQAPPNESEHKALQEFTGRGGTLITGPRWHDAQSQSGAEFPKMVAGKGSIRGFPNAKAVESDNFSRTLRDMVDRKHGAPKLYNVGSIISLYSVNPENGQALLQMTEYGDFPTENITIKVPYKVKQARLFAMGQEPQDLKIYDGEEEGSSEIDVPQVPYYCAVMIDSVSE